MIKISSRDQIVQEWIDEQMKDNPEYTYYKDISKVKLLKWIHEDISSAINIALKEFRSHVPLYPDIQVNLGENLQEGAIARYISGSSPSVPIVYVGVNAIVKSLTKDAKKYAPEAIENFIRKEIYPSVIVSVLHELGHAIVDEYREFGWESDAYNSEEDFVEEFARDLYDGIGVDSAMKKIISDIQRLRNGEELEEND